MSFAAINRAALAACPSLLERWLPGGRVDGGEFVALNPTRADASPGSFRISLRSGKWSDFATGDKGGDPISLYAYLRGHKQQGEAARALAAELGIEIPKPNGALANLGKGATGSPNHGRPLPRWRRTSNTTSSESRPRPGASADAAGELLFLVTRFDATDGEKEELPLSWCRATDGGEGWR